MSGYIYILKHGGMPGYIRIGTTKKPVEEVLKPLGASFKCTHLWACDWSKKLEKAIQENYSMSRHLDDNKVSELDNYFNKKILRSLHLFIDAYLKEDRNVSRETRELLQSTKEKRPTRSEMSMEEKRLDEIARANEASKVRRKEEGIYRERSAQYLLDLLSPKPKTKTSL